MHFPLLPILFLNILPLAFSLPYFPLSPRATTGVDAIVAAIDTIEADIQTLNTTLNGFEAYRLSTIISLLKIQEQSSELGDAITEATAVVNETERLNSTDSLTLATSTLTLEPLIFSLLANIIAHKPVFDASGLGLLDVTSSIHSTLLTQQELAREFGSAVVAVLDAAYEAAAQQVSSEIQAAFAEAVGNFSTPGGLIPVPDLSGLDLGVLEGVEKF